MVDYNITAMSSSYVLNLHLESHKDHFRNWMTYGDGENQMCFTCLYGIDTEEEQYTENPCRVCSKGMFFCVNCIMKNREVTRLGRIVRICSYDCMEIFNVLPE